MTFEMYDNYFHLVYASVLYFWLALGLCDLALCNYGLVNIPGYYSVDNWVICCISGTSKFNEGNVVRHIRTLTQCVFELV